MKALIYFKDLMSDKRFSFGFTVVVILTVLASISVLSPYSPVRWNVVPEEKPPSLKYLMGTTSLGQDLFWIVCFSIKNSLIFALTTAFLSRILAIVAGMVSGFEGGMVDKSIMILSDSLISLPRVPILILIGAIFREGLNLYILALVMASLSWAWDARVIRSQILSLRERDFTFTAILSGSRPLSIVFKEYFPHILPIVFASTLNNMLWAIGIETTLSILGLTNPLMPTLGTTLHWALSYQALFLGVWWWVFFPVTVLIFLFISVYLLSVSISEYLDPRMRIQRIGQVR